MDRMLLGFAVPVSKTQGNGSNWKNLMAEPKQKKIKKSTSSGPIRLYQPRVENARERRAGPVRDAGAHVSWKPKSALIHKKYWFEDYFH